MYTQQSLAMRHFNNKIHTFKYTKPLILHIYTATNTIVITSVPVAAATTRRQPDHMGRKVNRYVPIYYLA